MSKKYHAGEFESFLSPQDPLLRRLGLLQIVAEPGQTFTSSEIARFTGYTRQRIDQIEASARNKLRNALMKSDPQLVEEFRQLLNS